MKLVNAHKLLVMLVALLVPKAAGAQQIWTLEQCITTALEHNKNLKINQNTVVINELLQKEAKANLIPKLTANGDYQYFIELPHQLMPMSSFNPAAPEGQFIAAQFGVPHNIGANLQLAMPLFHNEIYGGIKSAGFAVEISKLQQKKSEEEVYFEVSNLYYNAQILKYQMAFMDSNLANTRKLLENMALMNEHKLAKTTDVDRVRLQVEQLSTRLEIVSNSYLQILDGLKLLMGVELETSIEVEPDIKLNNDSYYINRESLDFKILGIQNKLLRNELKTLNKARFLPTASLVASYGTSGFGYDKSPDEFLDFYSVGFVGIKVSYPIFNGMVTKTRFDRKKIELVNNELKAELTNEQNKMQIERAERMRAVALKSVANTGKQAALAESIYNQTLLQQKQATASLTEVLLADNALREAQQYYVSAMVDYLKADLELKKLTGNILSNGYNHYEK